MSSYSPIEFLQFALNHFNIEILSFDGNKMILKMDYVIEIEGDNLFKLMQRGQVIAPFADVEELCNFIKMDMQLNEEG